LQSKEMEVAGKKGIGLVTEWMLIPVCIS